MSHKHHLRLAGGRIEYLWFGPGPAEAPTLVFLHEGLGTAALWKDFPKRLAEATGCGALVYTRFGYGGSDPVSLPRPLTYHHDEALGPLPELLAALKIDAHILIGHSDGATIALINSGLAPHPRLLAVIVEAPHVFVEEMTIAGIATTRDQYHQGLRERLTRHHGDNVDVAFGGWAETWLDPGFRDWNVEPVLLGVRAPLLVIQGRGDEYASLEQVERIVAGVSGPVESLVVENCGHTPHREQAEQVLGAMTEFVRRFTPAP